MTNAMPSNQNSYPKECEFVIPIILKVPIYLELEVIGNKPVCRTNGHMPYTTEPVTEEAPSYT